MKRNYVPAYQRGKKNHRGARYTMREFVVADVLYDWMIMGKTRAALGFGKTTSTIQNRYLRAARAAITALDQYDTSLRGGIDRLRDIDTYADEFEEITDAEIVLLTEEKKEGDVK